MKLRRAKVKKLNGIQIQEDLNIALLQPITLYQQVRHLP